MKIGTSKAKGNAYENKLSKQLSQWLFNDKNILQRHLTSGAIKSTYVGDIVPIKPISWKTFPILIECKYGYKDHLPTLMNFSIIEEWLTKSLKESELSDTQKIIWLITRFHNQRSTLFFTSYQFDRKYIIPILELNILYQNKIYKFYQYQLETLVEFDFNLISNFS